MGLADYADTNVSQQCCVPLFTVTSDIRRISPVVLSLCQGRRWPDSLLDGSTDSPAGCAGGMLATRIAEINLTPSERFDYS